MNYRVFPTVKTGKNDIKIEITFTGKETDCETGYSYFGARYYDPSLLTSWTAVDPMSDKYPGISPYAYCAWNPVKLVDPDGQEWEKPSDETTANHIREAIADTKKYNNVIINRLQHRLDWCKPNSKRASKLSQTISELQGQNSLLDNLATGLDNMENNPNTIVTFSGSDEIYNETSWDGQISEDDSRNHITIRYQNDNMGSLIHESVHGYRFLKNKGRFKSKSVLDEEVLAYQTQYSYCSWNMPSSRPRGSSIDTFPYNLSMINTEWVSNIYFINKNGEEVRPYEKYKK